MSAQVLLFAGTGDGRRLAELLAGGGVPVLACVATDYGGELLEGREHLTVRAGRMNAAQMLALIGQNRPELVVDATHPYAQAVSEQIQEACARAGVELLRVEREGAGAGGVIAAPDIAGAARLLAERPGRVLLTIGGQSLAAFTCLPDYQTRLYARVLPDPEVIRHCVELGFARSHLICMQGPFSHEMNAAIIRHVGAQLLVSKDSGAAGGFAQKLSAARAAGIPVIVVGRPAPRAPRGVSYERAAALLRERFGLPEGPVPRFPLFISLAGRPAVLIGGGEVAQRRAAALLEYGAVVRIIAPRLHPRLQSMARRGLIDWTGREYRLGDLSGAALAVAATDRREVNRAVAREAAERGVPLSVADRPQEGSFWFPALIRGGGLSAGLVSLEGDHSLAAGAAAHLRRSLEEWHEDCANRDQG